MRTFSLAFFVFSISILTSAQDVKSSNQGLSNSAVQGIYDLIFSQDFEHHQSPIEYTTSLWNPDWNYPGWRDGDHRIAGWWEENIKDSIVLDNETGSTVMKFNFKDTIIDGVNGYQPYRGGDLWLTDLKQQPKELYFSYNVKFKPGFEAVLGGKLPGTRGGTPLSHETLSNSLPPAEDEGYSCYVLFKDEGRLQWYMYHHAQSKELFGETTTWNDYQPDGLDYTDNGAVSLDVTSERWYNITIRAVVNSFTDGKPNKDGIMEGFVDGKLVSSMTGLYLLPAADINKGVNTIAIGHFFGGGDNRFGPIRDEWTLFDDFICFTYSEGIDVPRGNTPSQPERILLLPNLKTQNVEELDTSPPSTPSGLRSTKKTGTYIDITWNPSQDNSAVEGYRIFVNGHRKGLSEKSSYRITELEPNTTYSITVSAYDRFSNESNRSEAIFVSTFDLDTIPPPIPTGLEAENSTDNSISVLWNVFSDSVDVEGFNIYSGGEIVGSADGNSFILKNLEPDTEYVITVTSFDAAMNESQPSAPIVAKTTSADLVAPSVPDGLRTTFITERTIGLEWNKSTDNVEVLGYRIFVNGLEKASSVSNTYTITDLIPGNNYSISVSAYDRAMNESISSEELFVTTDNPDNSITPILPNIEIVSFAKSDNEKTATAVVEIHDIGHTDLIDFGIMVSKTGDEIKDYKREIIFANNESSEFIHLDRESEGMQLMYDFTEGGGSMIYDQLNSENSVDLKINNPLVTSWLPGQGLKVDDNTLISSEEAPVGLLKSIATSNEITMESWIRTGSTDQSGPARIISISKDSKNRVATIGQQGGNVSYNYIARLTTSTTSLNGTPEVASNGEYNRVNLHHVVYTRNVDGIEKLYINGEENYSGLRIGDIEVGDDNYLALANELSGEKPWIGNYYLIAVYNKALSEKDIYKNFTAGTGIVKYSSDFTVESNESFIITPFARTIQGIAYGESVELNADRILHSMSEDSISLEIYPNPSNGDFKINVKCNIADAQLAYLRISNMMGQIIHNEKLSINEICDESQVSSIRGPSVLTAGKVIDINLSSKLINGIYLVTLIIGDQPVGSRLVVQH